MQHRVDMTLLSSYRNVADVYQRHGDKPAAVDCHSKADRLDWEHGRSQTTLNALTDPMAAL